MTPRQAQLEMKHITALAKKWVKRNYPNQDVKEEIDKIQKASEYIQEILWIREDMEH